MNISKTVRDRLLLSKAILQPIRFTPVEKPSNFILAQHVLTAHDAAELAIAAIAEHLNCGPSDKAFLMNYFGEIRKSKHPNKDVVGKDYLSQLNSVRINVKHKGIYPNCQQWHRVGETTYEYIGKWCDEYLDVSFDDLDESELISNSQIKSLYKEAQQAHSEGEYQRVFENLVKAEYVLFNEVTELHGLNVAEANVNDAIKLSSHGVNANDYLQLQEFLPGVTYDKRDGFKIAWNQTKYISQG